MCKPSSVVDQALMVYNTAWYVAIMATSANFVASLYSMAYGYCTSFYLLYRHLWKGSIQNRSPIA